MVALPVVMDSTLTVVVGCALVVNPSLIVFVESAVVEGSCMTVVVCCVVVVEFAVTVVVGSAVVVIPDRKSTRLNSSHL